MSSSCVPGTSFGVTPMGHVHCKSTYSEAITENLDPAFSGHVKDWFADRLESLALELRNAHMVGLPSVLVNGSLTDIARLLYSARRGIDAVFGHEGFSTSPGWDVMLDLFQSEEAGKKISVSSACIGAACPPTTALRWIQALESMGFVERVNDVSDRRRSFLQLTIRGRAATEEALKLHWSE